MLPANHPAVVAECERRADVKLARECPDEDDDGQSPKRRKRQTEKEHHDSWGGFSKVLCADWWCFYVLRHGYRVGF